MAVAGTFDGQKYQDLRVLMPVPIRKHYDTTGESEDIIRVRFPPSVRDLVNVTVAIQYQGYEELRTDHWERVKSSAGWEWKIKKRTF